MIYLSFSGAKATDAENTMTYHWKVRDVKGPLADEFARVTSGKGVSAVQASWLGLGRGLRHLVDDLKFTGEVEISGMVGSVEAKQVMAWLAGVCPAEWQPRKTRVLELILAIGAWHYGRSKKGKAA